MHMQNGLMTMKNTIIRMNTAGDAPAGITMSMTGMNTKSMGSMSIITIMNTAMAAPAGITMNMMNTSITTIMNMVLCRRRAPRPIPRLPASFMS